MGMRFSETKCDTLTTHDGLNLDIHIWEPARPQGVLMAIHGGLAHAGDYVTPALYFKEKGLATVAYDLRGHKQKKTYIANFELFLKDTQNFLQWTKNAYPDLPIIVLGHSMGSLIATHFGIRKAVKEDRIKGYALSSPYYENAIKVSPVMIPLVKILGKILPKMIIPGPELTDVLTRDDEITKRHHQDEKDGLRSLNATMRFGSELLKAQKWVKENIHQWQHPLFAVVAGADQVADANAADSLLRKVDPQKLTYVLHKENYHENYNEINRQETFDKMFEWMAPLIGV